MKYILIITFAMLSLKSQAWGFFAHKEINRLAVYTLPPEMIDFYKQHIDYLTEHAVDPDKRRYAVEGEAPKHFIDLDHFCVYPCSDFPKKYMDAVETYTEDTLKAYGTVPWTIEQYCYRLTNAFKENDANKVLKLSADLGHYVGDSHVPLHTTENYNGQLTDQVGIHGFWESRLPELFHGEYDFFVGKASFISDISSFVWENVLNAHSKLEVVLEGEMELSLNYTSDQKYGYDIRGQSMVKTYSANYSDAYHNLLDGMVEEQMRLSVKHLGDLWFTCWVNAGQPPLDQLTFKEEVPVNEPAISLKLKTRKHVNLGIEIFKD